MVYKKKNHYNEWEFVYDPITEQMMSGGNSANNAGLTNTSTTTPTTSTTPTTTTTPATP
jgi:hypothetical protein